jgi:Ca2+-binding EF-hand superfamily protein
MRPDFSQLDADGDGQITKAEMQQHHMARFSKVDTDQDGVLSRAELEAEGRQRVEEHVSRMIERHDANGDGVLSPDEMARPEKAGKMFERLDADNSGGISEAEFKEVRAKMGERGHGKKMRDCDKAKE